MYWRVLIYSSDYKHPDLSPAHPQTHSIMQGVDTPRLRTVIVQFCVYTADSPGRARHRTNYTNNVGIGLPNNVDEIQYRGTATPVSVVNRNAHGMKKIGYTRRHHKPYSASIMNVVCR